MKSLFLCLVGLVCFLAVCFHFQQDLKLLRQEIKVLQREIEERQDISVQQEPLVNKEELQEHGVAQPTQRNTPPNLAEKGDQTFVKIKLQPVGKLHRTNLDMNTDDFSFGYSKIQSGENELSGRVVAAKLKNGMTLLVIADNLKEFNKEDTSEELKTKVFELSLTGMRLFVEEMESPALGCSLKR